LDEGLYDAAVSLEVLMHIIEERDFVATLELMFSHARRIVVIQAPLVELIPYYKGSHERHRELLPYLEREDFDVEQVIVHPSVTLDERLAGAIGDMSSDFVIMRRRVEADLG